MNATDIHAGRWPYAQLWFRSSPLTWLVQDGLVFGKAMVSSAVNARACCCAAQDRKVAMLLYGFPPNVGATGTAALLNVPKVSLRTEVDQS